MIRLLSRWFIPDRDNVSSPAVRRAYGTLCGAVGIALNILLFIGKFFAGQLSGSIAVTADAFNNLSDAGSSAVTLLGFRLAGKKPDTDHPFGHGRIEYISGLIVAGLILLMGVELADSQEIFDNPVHPYTEALLGAIPTTENEEKRELQVLEGDIPSPVNPPKGCKFHTRCAYCTDICKHVVPEWEEIAPNHFVACHHKLGRAGEKGGKA